MPLELDALYRPQPKQAAFHANPARYRLMVGGAGSGKSLAMLWEAVRWCILYPGIRVLLIRRNYPELEKGLIADLKAAVPRDLFRWNDTKHTATFDSVGGAPPSQIQFGFLEGAKDAGLAQYLSSAFPLIGIDEVGQFSYKQWEFLSTRNRVNAGCTGGPRPGMIAATNPMGPGWGWLKALFVDGKPCAEMGEQTRFRASDYWYIHSTVLDNDALMQRDPGYYDNLKQLSTAMREKLLYGNLDTVSGQYYTCWQPNVHVLPADAFDWQPWQRAWLGLDWGLAHYTAVLWLTRARHRALGRTVTVCYRERVFNEKSLEEAGQIIHAATNGDPAHGSPLAERRAISSIFASHELFARRTAPQSSQTVAAEFSRILARHGLPGLVRAAGSSSYSERVRGAIMLYEDIAANNFFVLDTCARVAESIPLLTRDPDYPEDVLKSDTMADDVFDALKHAILSVSVDREEPAEARVAAQAAEIADPLSRWMFLTRAKRAKKPLMYSPTRASGPLWQTRSPDKG